MSIKNDGNKIRKVVVSPSNVKVIEAVLFKRGATQDEDVFMLNSTVDGDMLIKISVDNRDGTFKTLYLVPTDKAIGRTLCGSLKQLDKEDLIEGADKAGENSGKYAKFTKPGSAHATSVNTVLHASASLKKP